MYRSTLGVIELRTSINRSSVKVDHSPQQVLADRHSQRQTGRFHSTPPTQTSRGLNRNRPNR
jgi:hypothetical protein